jgi:predicted phage terminase large subunit-like protein
MKRLDDSFYLAAEAKLEMARLAQKAMCEKSLAYFVKTFWDIIEPGAELAWNWHIDVICGYLEEFVLGNLPNNRLIINVPPGALKSVLVSVMMPAWVWAIRPEERILTISNEQGLAIRDAIRMKQIVLSPLYQALWPLKMQQDQNEKLLYANEKRGFRQALGITASVTGKRGDCIIIDDPLDAKQAFSDIIRQSVNDTWDQSLTTRVNDPVKSKVVLIMQRLHEDDLTGHLLKKTATKWTHLTIPMLYLGQPTFDGKDIGRPDLVDPRKKKGELMFSSRFTKASVLQLKEDLGEYGFSGQQQQDPLPSGGGIIKDFWWRIWPDDITRPKMLHIFHSWDTAFSEQDIKTAAYSARTRWGIFWHEERDRYCIMALGMWFDRVGYDELRAKVKADDKQYDPDINLIENKATGISLLQDLRKASPGRFRAYTPGRNEDKVSRAHSVSPLFQAGLVYVPNKPWSLGCKDKKITGLIEYVAKFPAGAAPTPDLTDTVTAALIYMRRNGYVGGHPDDKDLPFDASDHRTEEQMEDAKAKETRHYYT